MPWQAEQRELDILLPRHFLAMLVRASYRLYTSHFKESPAILADCFNKYLVDDLFPRACTVNGTDCVRCSVFLGHTAIIILNLVQFYPKLYKKNSVQLHESQNCDGSYSFWAYRYLFTHCSVFSSLFPFSLQSMYTIDNSTNRIYLHVVLGLALSTSDKQKKLCEHWRHLHEVFIGLSVASKVGLCTHNLF